MVDSSVRITLGLELDKASFKKQVEELQAELSEYRLKIGIKPDDSDFAPLDRSETANKEQSKPAASFDSTEPQALDFGSLADIAKSILSRNTEIQGFVQNIGQTLSEWGKSLAGTLNRTGDDSDAKELSQVLPRDLAPNETETQNSRALFKESLRLLGQIEAQVKEAVSSLKELAKAIAPQATASELVQRERTSKPVQVNLEDTPQSSTISQGTRELITPELPKIDLSTLDPVEVSVQVNPSQLQGDCCEELLTHLGKLVQLVDSVLLELGNLSQLSATIVSPNQNQSITNIVNQVTNQSQGAPDVPDPTLIVEPTPSTPDPTTGLEELLQNLTSGLQGGGLDLALLPLAGAISALGIPLASVVQAIAPLGQLLIDTFTTFAPIQARFNTIGGSEEAGQGFLDYVLEFVDRTSQPLMPAIDGYSRLIAAAQGTRLEGQDTETLFEGVSKAVAALGLSGEDASGIFLALGQIISSGKVQAEELRGQIGERLPGTMQLFANSLGISVAELNEAMERGELVATTVLPKFGELLEEKFGDASLKASKNFVASLNRIQTALIKLQLSFVETFGGIANNLASTVASVINPILGLFDKLVLQSGLFYNVLLGLQTLALVGVGQLITKFNLPALLAGSISTIYGKIGLLIVPFAYGIANQLLAIALSRWVGIEVENSVSLILKAYRNLAAGVQPLLETLASVAGAVSNTIAGAFQGLARGAGSVLENTSLLASRLVDRLTEVGSRLTRLTDTAAASAQELGKFTGIFAGQQPIQQERNNPLEFFNVGTIAKTALEFTGLFLITAQTALVFATLGGYLKTMVVKFVELTAVCLKSAFSFGVLNKISGATTVSFTKLAIALTAVVALLALVFARSSFALDIDQPINDLTKAIKEAEKAIANLSGKTAVIRFADEGLDEIIGKTERFASKGINLTFFRDPSSRDALTTDDLIERINQRRQNIALTSSNEVDRASDSVRRTIEPLTTAGLISKTQVQQLNGDADAVVPLLKALVQEVEKSAESFTQEQKAAAVAFSSAVKELERAVSSNQGGERLGTVGEMERINLQTSLGQLEDTLQNFREELGQLEFKKVNGDLTDFRNAIAKTNPALFAQLKALDEFEARLDSLATERLQITDALKNPDLAPDGRQELEKRARALDDEFRSVERQKRDAAASLSASRDAIVSLQEQVALAREAVASSQDLNPRQRREALAQLDSLQENYLDDFVAFFEKIEGVIVATGEEKVAAVLKSINRTLSNLEQSTAIIENQSGLALAEITQEARRRGNNRRLLPDLTTPPDSVGLNSELENQRVDVTAARVEANAAKEILTKAAQALDQVEADFREAELAQADSPTQSEETLAPLREQLAQAQQAFIEAERTFNENFFAYEQSKLDLLAAKSQESVREAEFNAALETLAAQQSFLDGDVLKGELAELTENLDVGLIELKIQANTEEFLALQKAVESGAIKSIALANQRLSELQQVGLDLQQQKIEAMLDSYTEEQEKALKLLSNQISLTEKYAEVATSGYERLNEEANNYLKLLDGIQSAGDAIASFNQATIQAQTGRLNLGSDLISAISSAREGAQNPEASPQQRSLDARRLAGLQSIAQGYGVRGNLFDEAGILAAQEKISKQIAETKIDALKQEQALASKLLNLEIKRNEISAQVASREAQINKLKAEQAVLQARLNLQKALEETKDSKDKTSVKLAELDLQIAELGLRGAIEGIGITEQNNAIQQAMNQIKGEQLEAEQSGTRDALVGELINDPNLDVSKLAQRLIGLRSFDPNNTSTREVFGETLGEIDRQKVTAQFRSPEYTGDFAEDLRRLNEAQQVFDKEQGILDTTVNKPLIEAEQSILDLFGNPKIKSPSSLSPGQQILEQTKAEGAINLGLMGLQEIEATTTNPATEVGQVLTNALLGELIKLTRLVLNAGAENTTTPPEMSIKEVLPPSISSGNTSYQLPPPLSTSSQVVDANLLSGLNFPKFSPTIAPHIDNKLTSPVVQVHNKTPQMPLYYFNSLADQISPSAIDYRLPPGVQQNMQPSDFGKNKIVNNSIQIVNQIDANSQREMYNKIGDIQSKSIIDALKSNLA